MTQWSLLWTTLSDLGGGSQGHGWWVGGAGWFLPPPQLQIAWGWRLMRAYTSEPLNVGAIIALILQTQIQKKFVKIGLNKMYWLFMGNWPPKTKRKDFFLIKWLTWNIQKIIFCLFWVKGVGPASWNKIPHLATDIFGRRPLLQFCNLFRAVAAPPIVKTLTLKQTILDKTHLTTVHSPLITSEEAVFVFCAWDQAAPLAGACFLQIFERI